jgi:hypothetical protein
MQRRWVELNFVAMGTMAAILAALASGEAQAQAQRRFAGLPPSASLLLRFDADHDGIVTREEMDAGLKTDFAAADTNGDGCLNPQEMRAENERRIQRDGQEASPLVDWNLDGCLDMREFGNTAHSYFDLADRTKDGRVTALELRGPSMPIAPRSAPTRANSSQSAASTAAPPGTPVMTGAEGVAR